MYTQPILVANIQRNHHHNTAKRLKPSCLNLSYPNHLKDLANRYLLYTINKRAKCYSNVTEKSSNPMKNIESHIKEKETIV